MQQRHGISATEARQSDAPLSLSGMPAPAKPGETASCCSVAPGQEVLYQGKVSGGPRYGSRGIVKAVLRRKAVVNMGRSGTWHVPYHFLAVPKAA